MGLARIDILDVLSSCRLAGWRMPSLISIGNAFGASGFQQLIACLVKPIESALQVEGGVSQLGAGCGIAV